MVSKQTIYVHFPDDPSPFQTAKFFDLGILRKQFRFKGPEADNRFFFIEGNLVQKIAFPVRQRKWKSVPDVADPLTLPLLLDSIFTGIYVPLRTLTFIEQSLQDGLASRIYQHNYSDFPSF